MTPPKILIVEDNPVNLELARDILENCGFEVLAATNGLEALEIIEQTSPDLVLMDLQLPGMSGITVAERIKANETTAHIPIVAVTAFAMSTDKDRARSAGCVGFITKPINTREFPQQVQEFLDMSIQKTT